MYWKHKQSHGHIDPMNNKKTPCKNILIESKILGQHSHILLPLALRLIRKSENMTLLCTIDSMEEFEVLRRKNGCMVDKAKSKRKRASIKPCYERIAMYSCKYKKMAKFMKQPLAGLCPFRMLPMPDNEQKGKIRVFVEGCVPDLDF